MAGLPAPVSAVESLADAVTAPDTGVTVAAAGAGVKTPLEESRKAAKGPVFSAPHP